MTMEHTPLTKMVMKYGGHEESNELMSLYSRVRQLEAENDTLHKNLQEARRQLAARSAETPLGEQIEGD
jgi:hypothetical protein